MDRKASIKSITADTVTIAGYGVVFGGSDLDGETFTKDTDYMLDLVPNKLTLYDHGMNQAIKTSVIGRIPADNIKADEFGLWIEAELARSNEYTAYIMALAEKGVLGWSSGSVSHLVERSGKTIKSWPIIEFSLTPTPAEPRTLGAEVMKSLAEFDAGIKALLQVSTDAKSVDIQPEGEEGEAGQPKDVAQTSATATESNNGKSTSEVEQYNGAHIMNEEIKTAAPDFSPILSKLGEISDAFKALSSRVEAVEKQPATQPGFQVEAPAVNLKTKRGDDETKSFAYWLKTGDDSAIKSTKASNNTDMNIGTSADGGYAVPVGHYAGIIGKMNETALYQKLGVIQIPGSGTTVNVPIDGGATNVFVSTAEAGAFDRDAPALGQVAMTLAKYTKKVQLSLELLQDEDSALMTFLNKYVGDAMALTHNSLLVTEALANGTAGLTLAGAAAITAAEIPALMYKLKEQYDPGAAWLMNRTVEGYLRGFTGNNFQFVPTPQGTIGGSTRELFGKPIHNSTYMPLATTGLKSLVYGNFSSMGVRISPDVTVLRDPYSNAANGQVNLHYYFRVVYKVLQAEGIQYATQA